MSAGRELVTLLEGLRFPEGPRWREGRLLFSDFYAQQVIALSPDGASEVVCEVPGQPSGLGFTAEGDLLIVSMSDQRLLRLRDGELEEVADLSPFTSSLCNDMHVDASGRAYVGNFGSDVDSEPIKPTVMVRVDPDGTAAVAAEELIFPNGTQITPDGTLIVSETFAFRLSAYDVAADGTLANRRIWADFGDGPAPDLAAVLESDALAPDGICLDAEGALWVANATGSGAVRVREGGEIIDEVGLGELTAYAVELGGPDGRTLHLCAGPPLGEVDPATERRGSIITCRVDVPGRAWA